MEKRVLITGHSGYIGSVMAPYFVRAGYEVRGLDIGYFEHCTLVPDQVSITGDRKDLRKLDLDDVRGFDAVVHLGALSNDPIGNLSETWTEEINFRASTRLAELAREAGVKRFLFSSSCIMYGMSEAAVVTEESPLDPQTEYARSKVKAERAIRELASDAFAPTFMRNGTIYGVSPRMRFDTVFNNLVGSAVANGRVTLYSNGEPWRPVVHVEDVARAFVAALEAPVDQVWNEAFNTGADELNHQVSELAQIAAATVPDCQVEVLAQPGADQRTYKADFGKFARTFPRFSFKWTAKSGARELCENFKAIGLNPESFVDKRFTRLKWLRHLLDTGQLDQSLRWKERVQVGS